MQPNKRIVRSKQRGKHHQSVQLRPNIMKGQTLTKSQFFTSSKSKQKYSESKIQQHHHQVYITNQRQNSTQSLKFSKSNPSNNNSSSNQQNPFVQEKQLSLDIFQGQRYSYIDKQLLQLKKMELSSGFRETLLKFMSQKGQESVNIDNFVSNELRRLQKEKETMTIKQIRQQTFDTEILLKVLEKVISINKFNLDPVKSNIKTKQIETSFNFSLRALTNRQYPQARIQIKKFVQRASLNENYEYCVKLMLKTTQLIDIIQNFDKSSKFLETQKIQIIKNIQLSNKFIRQNKWTEIQKIKNRIIQNKQIVSNLNFGLMLESVIQNNKLKNKQITTLKSADSRKTVNSSLKSQQSLQIQTLTNQITFLRKQLDEYKLKIQKYQQQKFKEAEQLKNKSKTSNEANSSLKKIQQRAKTLQTQKKSLQVRNKSLQGSKKSISQKMNMLQKKNTTLQLLVKQKDKQINEKNRTICQNQRIIKLNKQKMEKLQRQILSIKQQEGRSLNSDQPSKVRIQELEMLQNDFNQLSRERQMQEQKWQKLLEQKDRRIVELQHKLEAINQYQMGKSYQMISIELEEKQKQVLKIKKQLIQALQTNKKKEENSASINVIQKLVEDILKIRQQKKQKTLGEGFKLQLLTNIQREQWRQVSKKIKQYKKLNPKNKVIDYFDEKHKYEFDQAEKLLDSEQKLLCLMNGIFNSKSIIKGGNSTLSIKANNKWFENVSLLYIDQKNEVAKNFNQLMDQFYSYVNKNKIDNKKNSLEKSISKSGSKQKITISEEEQNLKDLIKQINNLETILLAFLKNCPKEGKILQEAYSNNQFFSKRLQKQLRNYEITSVQSLWSQIVAFNKFFSNLIVQRQLFNVTKTQQISNLNKISIQKYKELQKQSNLIKLKINQFEKQKKIFEKNLETKNKQIEKLQLLKEKLKQHEEKLKEYEKYKQIIEQEEKIVQQMILVSESCLPLTAETIKKNELSHSKSTPNTSNLKSKSFSGIKNNSNGKNVAIQRFQKKYQNNSKVMDYLQRNKILFEEEMKKSREKEQLICDLSEYLNGWSIKINQQGSEGKMFMKNQKKKWWKSKNEILTKLIAEKNRKNRFFNNNVQSSLSNKSPVKIEQQHQSSFVHFQNNIIQTLQKFQKTLSDKFENFYQISISNFENAKKLSTFQLNQQQTNYQIKDLEQMKQIFDFILKQKIIYDKVTHTQQLLTEKSGSLIRNPQIIRQIFVNQIKKKREKNKYNMQKKNQPSSPKSFDEYSFVSLWSVATSRLEQHPNVIVQTVFKLFSKINELHIQYEDALENKNQQIKARYEEQLSKLRIKNQQLQKNFTQTKEKYSRSESQNKGSKAQQASISQLQLKYNEVLKNLKQSQKRIKQLMNQQKAYQSLKKQMEDERILIDKILSSSIFSSRIVITSPRKLSSSRTTNLYMNEQVVSQFDEKKQVNLFKRTYPKSNFLVFYQSVIKKNSALQTRTISLEKQRQSLIYFYSQFVKDRSINNFDNLKPNFKFEGTGQLAKIFGQMLKMLYQRQDEYKIIKSKSDIDIIKKEEFAQQSKELKEIKKSLEGFNIVILSLQKNLQQKGANFVIRNVQQIFKNINYLKNLYQTEYKKNKNLNFEPINTSFTKYIQQFSNILNKFYQKKNEQIQELKQKMTKQKQQLNNRNNDTNLRNKQLEIVNKQFSTENKFIKESLKKLQSQLSYMQQNQRFLQSSQKAKQYQILRLKQTIETYINQQKKYEMMINKLEKEKKDMQRQIQKIKKQSDKFRSDIQDYNSDRLELVKIIQNLKAEKNQAQLIKSENQQVINSLKLSFLKNQKQIQAKQNRLNKIIQEKGLIQNQLNNLKAENKRQKTSLEKDLNAKKIAVENLQKENNKLEKQLNELTMQFKHLENTKTLQITHNLQIIKYLQSQLKQLNIRNKNEKDQLNSKIQLLTEQKNGINRKLTQKIQSYQNKLLQLDTVRQRQKQTYYNSLNRDIQQLNHKYMNLVQNHQRQKGQMKQKMNKLAADNQKKINQINQQKIQITSKYENMINDIKNKQFEDMKKVQEDIYRIKLENQRLLLLDTNNQKQIKKFQQEKRQYLIKISQYENIFQQMSCKIQNYQQKQLENQQYLDKLTLMQRKVKQYQKIMIQNNISLLNNSSQSQRRSINSLQNRLKDFQTIKQKCLKLEIDIQKLLIELQSQRSEKKLIKEQSQLNRQDYLKLSSQTKQQIRNLRQQNRILSYQKNISDNQLYHYKQNTKQLSQTINNLSQQIRTIKFKYEKQIFTMKMNIQKQVNVQVEMLKKQINQKNNQTIVYQNQINNLKREIIEIKDYKNQRDLQMVQLNGKIKEMQLKYKNQKEKYSIELKSENQKFSAIFNQNKQQINQLRLEVQTREQYVYTMRNQIQQKNKQITYLKTDVEADKKIIKVEKQHLQKRILQLQSLLQNQKVKSQQKNRLQKSVYISRSTHQNGQISSIKYTLNQKINQCDNLNNKVLNLQKALRSKQSELQNLKRFTFEVERKLQTKFKELIDLNKLYMQVDMKVKQMQRSSRFEIVQLKAQLEFQRKLNVQFEYRYKNLEKQTEASRTPVSPISIQKNQQRHYFKEQIHEQNLKLKREIQNVKNNNTQLVREVENLTESNRNGRLNGEIMQKMSLEIQRLQFDLKRIQQDIRTMQYKNKQLQQIKRNQFVQINNMEQIISKYKMQLQSQRQRILMINRMHQNQLHQFKVKLSRTQHNLASQQQRNFQLRTQISQIQIKHNNLQNNNNYLSSSRDLKQSYFLQNELSRYRTQINQLQKRLIQKDFFIKSVTDQFSSKENKINELDKQLISLKYQNQMLKNEKYEKQNHFYSENNKLQEILGMLHSHRNQNIIFQQENKMQITILLKITRQIQRLLHQNQQLNRKCQIYQKQIQWFKNSSGQQKRYEEMVLYFTQSLMEDLKELFISQGLISNQFKFTEMFCQLNEEDKIGGCFESLNQNIRNLVILLCQKHTYIKNIIKSYLQNNDLNALKALKQFCVSN